MTDMPTPLLAWQVTNGGTYWASKGNTKWSAVRIIKVSRRWAQVERVVPRNGKIIHRKGKVKLEELVKRDPNLKGKDKPKAPPSEVFAKVREIRAEAKVAAKDMPAPIQEVPPVVAPIKRTPAEEAAHLKRLEKLFEMLEDDSTDDDW